MRKFPGALCRGRDGKTYLAVYSFQHDVLVRPAVDMKGLERVAHVSYSKGKRQGGIDYFLVDGFDIDSSVRVKKIISTKGEVVTVHDYDKGLTRLPRKSLNGASRRYDLQTISLPLPLSMRLDILDFGRADTHVFCGTKIAKEPRGVKKETVEKIVPKTQVKRIYPEKVLTGGKQENTPQCILTGNIDFGKGCISGFVPGEEGGTFDGEFFYNFFAMPTGECGYCYAERNHKSFPKTLYQFDKQRLLDELRGNCKLKYKSEEIHGRPVDILRFGKRTESWNPFTHDEFMQTLDACAIIGTRAVIPTKFLPYIPEVASLLKRTQSVALFSVGDFAEFEQGAIMHGRTVRFRLEQARRYRGAGVNSNVYHMIVAHSPPTAIDRQILDFTDYGRKIPTQLLPMRFKGKELTRQMTGNEWDVLADKNECQERFGFVYEPHLGAYVKDGQATIIPKVTRIHAFWQNLVGNNQGNIRMCHHDDTYVTCGECFQGRGLVGKAAKN